jgi:hypothetical protein
MSDDPRSDLEKKFEDAYERAVVLTVAHALTLRKEGFDDKTIAEIFAQAATRGLEAHDRKKLMSAIDYDYRKPMQKYIDGDPIVARPTDEDPDHG